MWAPGWMSMPVSPWRPFAEHAGNQRHAEAVQFVGDAVNRHRFQAGIAEDDFVETGRGGVAVVGGLHVVGEQFPQVRQRFEKGDRLLLALGLEVDAGGSSRHRPCSRSYACLKARAICVGEASCRLSIRSPTWNTDVAHVQVLPAAVAGEQHVLEILGDLQTASRARQRAVAEVVSVPISW